MPGTDRYDIECLRGEFTDAGLMADLDRMAALFTERGILRIPEANVEFTSRAEIRAGLERLRTVWEFMVQTIHPGTVEVNGDQATGRTYVHEFGRFRDGTSHTNYAIYHDRYERTGAGWKFAERTYEILYTDDTPLPGRAAARFGAAT